MKQKSSDLGSRKLGVEGIVLLKDIKPHEKPKHGQRWGNWKFDAHNLELKFFVKGKEVYSVELKQCKDSPSILDWILQVAGKRNVATPEDIGNLVIALEDLAGLRLQEVCSFGRPGSIDFEKLLGKG